MVSTVALIAVLSFIIPMCFTPGPNNILCAAHGSQHGFRSSMPLIFGMAIGWSLLGLLIGAATVIIEENRSIFDALTYVGAAYIGYLAYHIATAGPMEEEEEIKNRLGFMTGMVLQVVNGKAWVHFLVLMTSFGAVFGYGFAGKVALVTINLAFGLPAVMTWTGSGTILQRLFSSPEASVRLNRICGLALLGVAIWVILPDSLHLGTVGV